MAGNPQGADSFRRAFGQDLPEVAAERQATQRQREMAATQARLDQAQADQAARLAALDGRQAERDAVAAGTARARSGIQRGRVSLLGAGETGLNPKLGG